MTPATGKEHPGVNVPTDTALRHDLIKAMRAHVAQPGEILPDDEAWRLVDLADAALAVFQKHQAAHDGGPSVQEAAADDRRYWDGEKAAE
jgi:hypothetical protein